MAYKLFYEPKGKAGEYAELALNIYKVCSHGCDYCYVPGILRITREEFRTGKIVFAQDFFEKLQDDCYKYRKLKDNRYVLLSFLSDPYQPAEFYFGITRKVINMFNDYGINYNILTKNASIIRDKELIFCRNAKIGMSISFLNGELRKLHEPYASIIKDRITTLEIFAERGIYTWVSIEPIFDVDEVIELIPYINFVNEIKVGKLNYNKQIENSIDWKYAYTRIVDTLEKYNCKYYIKNDLRKFGELNA